MGWNPHPCDLRSIDHSHFRYQNIVNPYSLQILLNKDWNHKSKKIALFFFQREDAKNVFCYKTFEMFFFTKLILFTQCTHNYGISV